MVWLLSRVKSLLNSNPLAMPNGHSKPQSVRVCNGLCASSPACSNLSGAWHIGTVAAVDDARGRHRANEEIQEVIYRVYHLPESLRAKMKIKRGTTATTSEIVHQAITESLPKVVDTFQQIGFRHNEKKRPARLPLQTADIEALKEASKKTSVPASRLLLASLSLTCDGEE